MTTNGGVTWPPPPASIFLFAGMIDFRRPWGTTANIGFAACGDTIWRTTPTRIRPTLNFEVRENNTMACPGNSGVIFSVRSGVFPYTTGSSYPFKIEMLSGPAGQVFTPDSLTIVEPGNGLPTQWGGSNTFNYQNQDLLPGNYIFRLYTGCGDTDTQNITLNHPLRTFTAEAGYAGCGANAIKVTIDNDSAWSVINLITGATGSICLSSNSPAPASNYYSQLKVVVLNAADSSVAIMSVLVLNDTVLLSTSATLPNGDYIIRVYKENNNTPNIYPLERYQVACQFVDIPYHKNSDLLSLSSSQTFAACNSNSWSIAAIALPAAGQYTYSLYKDSVSATTLVTGPQSSNLFNGLDTGITYIVTASDTCGRGTQYIMNYTPTPIQVYNSAYGMMPCPGSNLTLSVNNVPGVSYQWFKNDTAIPDATDYSYSISGITHTDSGSYKVQITIGTCVLFVNAFVLNPDSCGTPLPVRLLDFNVEKIDNMVLLRWQTVNEYSNKGFEIERSSDGRDWLLAGFVGNSENGDNNSNNLNYKFIDEVPAKGYNFYRLKQIDLDGKCRHSEVKIVFFEDKKTGISIHPNPAESQICISGLQGNELVSIYDVTGKLRSFTKAKSTKLIMSINEWSNGLYLLHIIDDNGKVNSFKIVKGK